MTESTKGRLNFLYSHFGYNRVMNESLQNNIDQLSPEQQLEVAHYIYQSLASTGQLLSRDQLAETKQRARQAKLDPDSTLSSDEMWRKVESLGDARKD